MAITSSTLLAALADQEAQAQQQLAFLQTTVADLSSKVASMNAEIDALNSMLSDIAETRTFIQSASTAQASGAKLVVSAVK
jgi:prefoldin subunit 5